MLVYAMQRHQLQLPLTLCCLLLRIVAARSGITVVGTPTEFRQCESIRIDMCRGIGYNETAMPNLVGHELQTDVEYTLQTFAPLIEYVCSTQLKLFLCAAYVPMCTPKVPMPIGPCRSLCESVRARCHPVLAGFGFPWPPALDCERFPRENNHETMCMEGPGETHAGINSEQELYGSGGASSGIAPGLGAAAGIGGSATSSTTTNNKLPSQASARDCPGLAKVDLYIKLPRSGRCAPLCEADILFTPKDKYLTEMWLSTWAYAALGVAIVATLCLIMIDDRRCNAKWSRISTPLVWCHDMVTIGWVVRFIAGRTATACGYDPQLPNVSLLSIDGLSNAPCAAVFLLRYYFGMAACVWWAILCLGWHREIRCNSPDAKGHITLAANYAHNNIAKRNLRKSKQESITHNNFVCFVAWGLPAFQTAAVVVGRFVDADELIGACFVGNQHDKGLQVLVATPIFCYWIFGSMNLISGYLVHRRNCDIMRTTNSLALQQQLKLNGTHSNGIGTFLFIYGGSCGILLFSVIYEFANIDVWLSAMPSYLVDSVTPLWPFLTRAFMELMLGIICFAWILGPYISQIYKRQLTPRTQKPKTAITSVAAATLSVDVQHQQQHQQQQSHQPHQQTQPQHHHQHHHHNHIGQQSHPQLSTVGSIGRNSKSATVVSYQSMRAHVKHPNTAGGISLHQMSNYSFGRSTHGGSEANAAGTKSPSLHLYVNNQHNSNKPTHNGHQQQQYPHQYHHSYNGRYGNETLL